MVRLLVARGATLPRAADALHRNTPSALVSYLDGARSWTPLHRAADARDHDALVALLDDLSRSSTRPDEAVDSPHPHMRTALSIAGSDSYPTARPVCERCFSLLQPGMVKGMAPEGVGGGGGGRRGGGGGGGGGSGGGGNHHATLPPPGSEERKQALEEWFSKAVLPTLRKGLINVCEKQPGDPIDHLAAFLFKHGGDVPSGMEVPHAHTHGVSSAAAESKE